MRVLHVNDFRTAGGCEVVMDTTVSLLRARGIGAEVFTSEDVDDGRVTPLSYLDSIACSSALSRVLRRYRPDVVHLHNFYHVLSPGILGALEGYRRVRSLRVVMTAHDYHLVCPSAGMTIVRSGRFFGADDRRLGSLAYLLGNRWDHRGIGVSGLKVLQHVWNYRLRGRRRVIDRVLCPSRYLERILARYGLPTTYVPYPAPQPEGSFEGRPPGRLKMIFAGRIEREKGLVEFLEILPGDFPGTLSIVGEGNQLTRCQAVCRRRDLEAKVRFAGRVSRREAMARIRRSHVLVLPSLWAENHPMSLLEALALGTNILVSNLGGMREIVKGSGVGFVFDPRTPSSLRRALDHVEAAFDAGTLNQFAAAAFLADRDENIYLERVLDTYGVGPAAVPTSRNRSSRSGSLVTSTIGVSGS